LQRTVACFRQARVPYALIGAWALAVWGRVPRHAGPGFSRRGGRGSPPRGLHRFTLRGKTKVNNQWRL
jgi:hypothetical protein